MLSEVTTFTVMVGAFILLVAALRLPAALATAGAAVAGLVAAGLAANPRHLIEGMFGYFDVLVIIATAMIFMKALENSGILEEISSRIVRRFGQRRVPLSLVSMVLVMIPGMLTGSSTASALTTGRFVLPVLDRAGFPRARAAAFVALGSIIGMIAPPVNIPVMIIGAGIDMPYVGFDIPLALIALPLAVLVALWAALGKRPDTGPAAEARVKAPSGGLVAQVAEPVHGIKGGVIYLPLAAVLLMMAAARLPGGKVPDPGIPLIFVVGTLFAAVSGRRISLPRTVVEGVGLALPVMGILVGAGMFVQVMTVSGVRGLLVTTALDIPKQYLFLGATAVLPLFGAISAYASSSVMGVPMLLALLGNNEIVTAAALSLMAAMGDLIPPIALVPTLAAQSIEPTQIFRAKVIRACVIPGLIMLAFAFLVLSQAVTVGKLIGS
ncbi:MAG: TRAP transporter large permease subunit [Firmicutes bacterium]|jgi:TRAP-type C4-dicarboxylate transport system permease large subunit|nr:TRAP transporter large permease subunit [Bacillota bacterium]